MKTLLPLMVSLMFGSTAMAAGDKNRLGDEDIEEGYRLCERAGVEFVVIEEDGIAVTIDCEEVPGWEDDD